MNEKIVKVLQKINGDPNRIANIARDGDEYFFEYAGEVMSVSKLASPPAPGSGPEYFLYFYPKESTAESAAQTQQIAPESLEMASFKASDFGQSRQLFAQLYKTISVQHLGLDDVIDRILEG